MRAMQSLANRLTRRPYLVLWLIAAYFGLAIILRVLRSEGLQSDEAEQLFQSQFWLLGYGRQPPFYNWLQAGVISLIDPSIFALSLVKNLLLFLTVFFYGLAARELLKDARLIAIAMLGVIAMPAVSVMAQRDLTHAIATLFAVSLFTYAFLRTLKRPSLGSYLLTGLAVGIGLISKYNFVIVPLAAVLAILPERELRSRVFDWRILTALGISALICLPHGLWVLTNLSAATEGTIHAMRENASGNPVLDRLSGLFTLTTAVLAGALPILGFFLLAFGKQLPAAWRGSNIWTRVVGRTIVLCLIVVGLIGLGFGATTISEKWLSPFLILLSLYLCLKLEAAGKDTSRAVPRMFLPVAALAVGFMIYIAVGNIIGPRLNQYTKENLPTGPFMAEVLAERSHGTPDFIIAADPFLAGSARIEAPDARVLLPSFAQMPVLDEREKTMPGLIIWQGNSLDALKPFLQANGIAAERLTPKSKTLPYLFSGGRRSADFGYAWVEPLR